LERLLEHLIEARTEGLRGAEVGFLIVDNCPDGQVRDVCERVAPRLPWKLDMVEEHRRGRTYARNRAAQEGLRRGFDFLAFIDDDDEPEPDWLERLVAAQAASGAEIVCGAMRPTFSGDIPAWLRSSPLFEVPRSDGDTKYGIPRGIGTFNAMIAVEVFRRMEAAGEIFSEEFAHSRCEDTEFFTRAKALGASFAIAPDSVVHRDFAGDRTTFAGLLRYSWQMGRYNMILLRRHGSPPEVRSRRRKALRKVLCDIPKMILRARSRSDAVRYLAGVAKEAGMLAGAVASRPGGAGNSTAAGLPGAGAAGKTVSRRGAVSGDRWTDDVHS